MSGERIQITGTPRNGQSCSTIEVLSSAYAWNEDTPGAELAKGKGKATPNPTRISGACDTVSGLHASRAFDGSYHGRFLPMRRVDLTK